MLERRIVPDPLLGNCGTVGDDEVPTVFKEFLSGLMLIGDAIES
jgi:hypothetical protein